ncbi:DEAD/DEAH box helicase, partial [Candidatus Woesearchaeota archaeon]|nr:DEAD/DEAH box helicase [Candidatus Woesearchaeota archaeon]
EEIEKIAGKKLGIRVAVRTGDTTQTEKSKMLKKPPHILITTPESLAIVLSSIKFRNHLRQVDWCIVDEIHALAENKRGVHLSLSLERLDNLATHMCRIGLSATVSPLEEIAKFLTGPERECKIVDVQFIKKMDLQVMSPVEDLIETTHETLHRNMYELIDNLIQEHKTTLIFTNTRAATERMVDYLKDKYPKKYSDNIGAHHGSLGKKLRLQLENRLRKGELKAVVCSTSLELGIDIGYIDLVICIGSPKSVARFLQRCLPYDAEILIETGEYLQIGKIVEEKLPVNVIVFDKKKGFVPKKIQGYYRYFDDELYEITLRCGETIRCTPNHPLLTNNGWKEARFITKKDTVAEVLHKINFKYDTPYIYELIPHNKFFVQNSDNFYLEIINSYLTRNNISLRKFSEKYNIPYFRILDCRRRRGRKKSIRLDHFLAVCKIAGLKFEEYSKHLKKIKGSGRVWPELPLKPTKELMWLAGIIATDGTIVRVYDKRWNCEYYHIKISNKSRILIDKAKEILQKIKINYQEYCRFDNQFSLEFGSNMLAYFFQSLGIKTKNKTRTVEVGKPIFKMSPDMIYAYLEGIFEGDGSFNKKYPLVRIFSASKRFITQLHYLFARLGHHTNILKNKSKPSKLIKKTNDIWIYYIHLSRFKDIQAFFENCPCFCNKAKTAKKIIRLFKPHHKKQLKCDDKYIHWEKVISIKKITKKIPVYDIAVEKSNFVAGNVIVHNSGRAGHKLHDKVKSRIIVMNRDDLVECAVLMKSAVEKKIDKIHIPLNCLDVLAQQIFGMALEEVWDEKELFKRIKMSYCYKDLTKKDFNEVLDYLSGKFVDLQERHVYAKIWRNEGKIGKRGRLSRVIYMTNIGTIPDESFILVKIGEQVIGKLDESFLERMKPGDVFVLGGNTYRFKFARGQTMQVSASSNRPPTVPSWVSEMLPLSFDLALEIGKLRRLLFEKFKAGLDKTKIMNFLHEYLYVDAKAGLAIYHYFKEQYDYTKKIPHDKMIIVEYFNDDKDKKIIFHTLFGRRVNDCLSRGIAYVISRNEHKDVEIGINDNGFYLSGDKKINCMKAFKLLKSSKLDL